MHFQVSRIFKIKCLHRPRTTFFGVRLEILQPRRETVDKRELSFSFSCRWIDTILINPTLFQKHQRVILPTFNNSSIAHCYAVPIIWRKSTNHIAFTKILLLRRPFSNIFFNNDCFLALNLPSLKWSTSRLHLVLKIFYVGVVGKREG